MKYHGHADLSFQQESVLPVQWIAKAQEPSHYLKRLSLALIEDASKGLSSRRKRVREEAEFWFASHEDRYVFSFRVCCELLNLDPDAARRGIVEHGKLCLRRLVA